MACFNTRSKRSVLNLCYCFLLFMSHVLPGIGAMGAERSGPIKLSFLYTAVKYKIAKNIIDDNFNYRNDNKHCPIE